MAEASLLRKGALDDLLLSAARSRFGWLRWRACRNIVAGARGWVVTQLLSELGSSTGARGSRVLRALLDVELTQQIPSLAKPWARLITAVVRRAGPPHPVEHLIACLASDSAQTREVAIRLLGYSASARAVAVLCRVLDDWADGYQHAQQATWDDHRLRPAVAALSRLGDGAAAASIGRLLYLRPAAFGREALEAVSALEESVMPATILTAILGWASDGTVSDRDLDRRIGIVRHEALSRLAKRAGAIEQLSSHPREPARRLGLELLRQPYNSVSLHRQMSEMARPEKEEIAELVDRILRLDDPSSADVAYEAAHATDCPHLLRGGIDILAHHDDARVIELLRQALPTVSSALELLRFARLAEQHRDWSLAPLLHECAVRLDRDMGRAAAVVLGASETEAPRLAKMWRSRTSPHSHFAEQALRPGDQVREIVERLDAMRPRPEGYR